MTGWLYLVGVSVLTLGLLMVVAYLTPEDESRGNDFLLGVGVFLSTFGLVTLLLNTVGFLFIKNY